MDNIIDNAQFFSGTKPNLINEKALRSINKIFNDNVISQGETTGEHLWKLYNDYIKPNMFGLLVIIIISFFLFIRYIIKKYNEGEKISDDIDTEKYDLHNTDSNDDDYDKNNKNNKKKIDLSESDKFTLETGGTENGDVVVKKNTEEDKYSENGDSRFTELNEEYNKAVRENIGQMSEEMIKDIYKKKKNKLSFDELTRIMVEGGT